MSTLKQYINRAKDQSTTDSQLRDALDNDVTIIRYTDLFNLESIDELFEYSNNVIILYPVESLNAGHYVALIRYNNEAGLPNSRNTLSYFDPYGFAPSKDIELASALRGYDPRMQQKLPSLLNAAKMASKYTINYNTLEFQNRSDKDLATCGKHCVARILFKNIISHKDYFNFLKFDNLTKDQIVSLMFL